MAEPSEDTTPEVVRPAAELLPEVYGELRRPAAGRRRMIEGHSDRVETLFHQAADLPPPAQRALLDTACRDEPGLRAAVERLLADDARLRADEGAAAFLNSPLVRPPPRQPSPPRRPRGRRCRRGSAATASCACSARAAWARCTRPSKTTRAAPSPSR